MPTLSKKAKVETWSLDRLRPNDLSRDFPATTAAVDQAAADLERHGQATPVDVLPNGTIVDEHVVVDAAKKLGWTAIRVHVPHDLADEPSAVEREFFAAVGRRPHLGPVWRVAIAVAVYWAERGRRSEYPSASDVAEILKLIAAVLGRNAGERTCRRYYRLTLAPPEIRAAFDRGEITLVQGERVSHLPDRVQRQIADRVAAGEDAKAAVAEFVSPKTGRHVKAGDALAAFCTSLVRGLEDLDGRLTEPSPGLVRRNRETLVRAGDAIRELLVHSDRTDAPRVTDTDDVTREWTALKLQTGRSVPRKGGIKKV